MDMETLSQEPQLSEAQLGKQNAMQSAFNKIEALAGTDSRDEKKVEAAKKLLEELRSSGNLEGREIYRTEQALTKLVEYFELESNLNMRKGEIINIYPDAAKKLAANDEHYTPDDKYAVV